MSEARFTKGPWTLETVKTYSGICYKIGPFPWRPDRQNHACIYHDYPNGMLGPVEMELRANAHLIAAAPDGYGFADAFIEYVRRSDLDDLDFGRGLQDSGLIEQAQAFLAKARGVQP